jgi:hypothetical protein
MAARYRASRNRKIVARYKCLPRFRTAVGKLAELKPPESGIDRGIDLFPVSHDTGSISNSAYSVISAVSSFEVALCKVFRRLSSPA